MRRSRSSRTLSSTENVIATGSGSASLRRSSTARKAAASRSGAMRSRSTGITSVDTSPRKLRAPSVCRFGEQRLGRGLEEPVLGEPPAGVGGLIVLGLDHRRVLVGQHRRRLERDQPGEQRQRVGDGAEVALTLRALERAPRLLDDACSPTARSGRRHRGSLGRRAPRGVPWNPGASTVIEAAPASSRCIATWYGRRGYPDRRPHPLRGARRLASARPRSSCPTSGARSRDTRSPPADRGRGRRRSARAIPFGDGQMGIRREPRSRGDA